MTKQGRIIIAVLFFAILVPLGAMAKKAETPAPFVPVSKTEKEPSIQEQFGQVYNLPQNATPRVLFFGESQINTGYDEEQLTFLVESGKAKAETVKAGIYETAGITPDGRAYYHREVNAGETVVFVPKGDTWIPWFLIRCDNPVRRRVVSGQQAQQMQVKAPSMATPPPQQYGEEVMVEQVVCLQKGSIFMVSPTTIYSGYTTSHQFNWLFTPTWCYNQETIYVTGGVQ